MLREYKYADMPHNYGALPQTWEDPDIIDEATAAVGGGAILQTPRPLSALMWSVTGVWGTAD